MDPLLCFKINTVEVSIRSRFTISDGITIAKDFEFFEPTKYGWMR